MISSTSPEQQAIIRDLWSRNFSIREIATAAKISRHRIPNVVAEMGLPDRKAIPDAVRREIVALHYSGHGYRAICDAVGLRERAVRRVIDEIKSEAAPPKRRTKWTAAENEAFRAGWDETLPRNENVRRIAEKIGRHPDGILSKAKMAGLIENSPRDPHQPTPERADKHAAACLREGGFPSFVEAPGAGFLFRDGRAVWAWPTDRRAA